MKENEILYHKPSGWLIAPLVLRMGSEAEDKQLWHHMLPGTPLSCHSKQMVTSKVKKTLRVTFAAALGIAMRKQDCVLWLKKNGILYSKDQELPVQINVNLNKRLNLEIIYRNNQKKDKWDAVQVLRSLFFWLGKKASL